MASTALLRFESGEGMAPEGVGAESRVPTDLPETDLFAGL